MEMFNQWDDIELLHVQLTVILAFITEVMIFLPFYPNHSFQKNPSKNVFFDDILSSLIDWTDFVFI